MISYKRYIKNDKFKNRDVNDILKINMIDVFELEAVEIKQQKPYKTKKIRAAIKYPFQLSFDKNSIDDLLCYMKYREGIKLTKEVYDREYNKLIKYSTQDIMGIIKGNIVTGLYDQLIPECHDIERQRLLKEEAKKKDFLSFQILRRDTQDGEYQRYIFKTLKDEYEKLSGVSIDTLFTNLLKYIDNDKDRNQFRIKCMFRMLTPHELKFLKTIAWRQWKRGNSLAMVDAINYTIRETTIGHNKDNFNIKKQKINIKKEETEKKRFAILSIFNF